MHHSTLKIENIIWTEKISSLTQEKINCQFIFQPSSFKLYSIVLEANRTGCGGKSTNQYKAWIGLWGLPTWNNEQPLPGRLTSLNLVNLEWHAVFSIFFFWVAATLLTLVMFFSCLSKFTPSHCHSFGAYKWKWMMLCKNTVVFITMQNSNCFYKQAVYPHDAIVLNYREHMTWGSWIFNGFWVWKALG